MMYADDIVFLASSVRELREDEQVCDGVCPT